MGDGDTEPVPVISRQMPEPARRRQGQGNEAGMTPPSRTELQGDEPAVDLRDLVERARRSDPDAWEQLFCRGYRRLVAYASRRLPGADDADDAVSEAYARAYDQIDRFRWKGGGFDAWMYGILRNVVLERRRARARAVDRRQAPDPPRADSGPLDVVLRTEEEAAVRAAFARLGDEDRELLELRVVGQLSAEEVGAVLGKRPGAVRMAQSRAVARLRAALGEVNGPDA